MRKFFVGAMVIGASVTFLTLGGCATTGSSGAVSVGGQPSDGSAFPFTSRPSAAPEPGGHQEFQAP